MEKQISLLIVDDDREIRHLMEQLLCKYDYKVFTACDGIEMFAILEKQTINLILLDVLLPGDDGFVLCQKIRSQYHIPIIMVTAIGETTDRIVGLEMGADDYLTKPFNTRELIARIKAVTRRTQGESAEALCDTKTSEQRIEFDGWSLKKHRAVYCLQNTLKWC